MVSEDGSLKAGNFGDGSIRFRLRGREFSHLQSDAREEEMRQGGFAGKRCLVEEFCGSSAKSAGFKIAAFVEEEEALIEV